ncbi:MAG: beta-galactosidase, partial [Anaerolineaceae bacterium]|nr:beta-galactosidase [Anaerolineaceae bacterium]
MKLIGYIIRHIIPISLLAIIGFGVYTVATPPPSSRIDGLGIDLLSSPPLTTEAVERQLNAIQQSGVKYVRIEMNWSIIESTQGIYDFSSVLPLDLFFSSAQARGLKSVAVITGFPVYLTTTGLPLDQQTIGLRWERFIQASVDHYGDQVNYWEIGDQINTTNSARSLAQSDPAFYSKMLKAASKIIKNTDPNDQVWMGSLVSATASNCAVNPLSFLLEVNAAKAWSMADAVTYQPRRGATVPELPSESDINLSCNASMAASSASLSAEVQSIQDLARQLGGKPVYITGLTWSPDELVSLQGSRAIDVNTLQSDLLVRASVMLTGGISLLELDPQYIAIKEAAIPGIIGLAVLGSQYTRFPLVRTLI